MNMLDTLRKQKGLTLVELLVVLAIITLLAVAIGAAYDPSRSRAQTLIQVMSELGNGNIRLKNDTGCYVNKPHALYSQDAAGDPSNNYCQRNFGNNWVGPYVTRFPVNTDGNATLDKVSADVVIEFQRELGGTGRRYFVRASNVPNDVIRQALQECNGRPNETATFDDSKCKATLGTGSSEVGTFDMLYDETR